MPSPPTRGGRGAGSCTPDVPLRPESSVSVFPTRRDARLAPSLCRRPPLWRPFGVRRVPGAVVYAVSRPPVLSALPVIAVTDIWGCDSQRL